MYIKIGFGDFVYIAVNSWLSQFFNVLFELGI